VRLSLYFSAFDFFFKAIIVTVINPWATTVSYVSLNSCVFTLKPYSAKNLNTSPDATTCFCPSYPPTP
jgi:hypothetical protein